MVNLRMTWWIATTIAMVGLLQGSSGNISPTVPVSPERMSAEVGNKAESVRDVSDCNPSSVGGGMTSDFREAGKPTSTKKFRPKVESSPDMDDEPQKLKSGSTVPTDQQVAGSNEKGEKLIKSVNNRRVKYKPPPLITTSQASSEPWKAKVRAWFSGLRSRALNSFSSGLKPVGSVLGSGPMYNLRRAAFLFTWPAYVLARPLRFLRCYW